MDINEKVPIKIKSIKAVKKQSIVVNNFFTIITIAIMTIVIIWYVNFILPKQEKNKLINEQKSIKLKQIQLAKKLNAKS